MLLDELRAPLRIAPRAPPAGLDQELDPSRLGHAEQAETKQPTKLAGSRIMLPAAPRAAHGEPDLIAGGGPIDALQDKLEIEAELELGDDDQRRRRALERDDVAAADLAFRIEAEFLEEAFDGRIERGFQARAPWLPGAIGQLYHSRGESENRPRRPVRANPLRTACKSVLSSGAGRGIAAGSG